MLYLLRTTGSDDRAGVVRYLQQHLPITLIVDQRQSIYHTNLMAYKKQVDEGVGAIHLEDDIALTQRFEEKVAAALKGKEHAIVNFFTLKNKRNQRLGSRWEPGASFASQVCTYIPLEIAKGLLVYGPSWKRLSEKWHEGSDTMVKEFLVQHRLQWYAHVPCLVQHLDLQSLVNPKTHHRGRASTCFDSPAESEGLEERYVKVLRH